MNNNSLKIFQDEVKKIKNDRDWHKFHEPKDLLLGIVEEIGEFRNLIKWEQDPKKVKNILINSTPEIRKEVINFFGDVMWYLASLADYCQVDLDDSLPQIIKELKERFPVKKVKGTTANPKTGGYDGKYR